MLKPAYVICFLLYFIKFSENRDLWESPVDEISATNQPFQINSSVSQLQITNLNGTLSSNFLSKLSGVKELRIIHNQIREIENGALCSSPNLNILELDLSGNTKPPTLNKNMFQNCNLDELFLKFDYNKPSGIDRDALESIPKLLVLGIDSLIVNPLQKDFLRLQSKSLKKLILSNIQTSQIDSGVFDEFTSLQELEITHVPQLKRLPANLFRKAAKLKRLVLKDNAIQNLNWDEFKGLSSLEELDLLDNRIATLDARKVAQDMPNLKKLFLEMNPVTCDQQKEFAHKLKTGFGKSVEIPKRYSLFGPCDV